MNALLEIAQLLRLWPPLPLTGEAALSVSLKTTEWHGTATVYPRMAVPPLSFPARPAAPFGPGSGSAAVAMWLPGDGVELSFARLVWPAVLA